MSIQRETSIVSTILTPVNYRGPDEAFTKHLQCRLKSLDTETATTKDDEADKVNNNQIYFQYEVNSPPESPSSPVENDEEIIITNGSHECKEDGDDSDSSEETYCNNVDKSEPRCNGNELVIQINGDLEEEEEEVRIPRIRRCSSLKSGKTPPGTPGQKKAVRFADVLGLDLADVRTYLDEIPKIPKSAYEDLSDVDLEIPIRQKPDKVLIPVFQQPGGETDFLDRVRHRQCCLENAVVQDSMEMSIAGTVRVRNIDFNKSVHIRYSLDAWTTYSDLQATYVQNSCDGFSDKFSFVLYCHTLEVGQRIEFAVRYSAAGQQFWDNNCGVNYCFQCLPSVNNTGCIPIRAPEINWREPSFY